MLAASAWAAVDFELPADEPASASLPVDLASGPNFHVHEPVESDGLMHHYVIDGRFGVFPAYGRDALRIRVREMAALTQIAKSSDVDVVAKTVEGRVQSDVKTLSQVTTHPVSTVVGIPKGIGHLFHGYRAQAGELIDDQKSHDGSKGPSHIAATARSDATRYADRYLGVSAAERRYYQQLGVDPYTNNQTLRKAVGHLAKISAATNLGLHFAGVPGLPYLGDVRRAMDAIYNEDPAVLRARQRRTLAGYGLRPEEIKRFENTLLLSPTRQALLEEEAKSLDGVAGRDELFRHAMSVTSEEEVQVFLQSVRLLAALHKQHPIAKILAGLRLPAAQTSDGHIMVIGAFDAVYWTEDVAGYEAALHAALPPASTGLQLWLSGSISSRARSELTSRGWDVHDGAQEETLVRSGGP
ncbi:MAG TPA: hypothetical protein VHS76_02850 [Steroidobacteraceae bacterium]|nr:hypothetical protein [Steroidobacteraceae bacterium]